MNTPNIKSSDLNNSIDLEATARVTLQSRCLWEGSTFVVVGYRSCNMTKTFEAFSPKLCTSFKENLLNFSREGRYSLKTIFAIAQALAELAWQMPYPTFSYNLISEAFNFIMFRNCKAAILEFFVYWKKHDDTVISEEALALLREKKANIPHPRNVTSDDPTKSWLTDEEYDSLLSLTWKHYDECNDTQPTLIRLLSLQYARRPIQLSQLKIKDIKDGTLKKLKNISESEIHFPAAKERLSEIGFRDGKYEVHPLPKHLRDLLTIQCREVKTLFQKKFNIEISPEAELELPLFSSSDRIDKAVTSLEQKLKLAPLENLGDELFHLNSKSVADLASWTDSGPTTNFPEKRQKKVKLPITPRTNQPIVLTTTRLRHTRARQLARLGVSKALLSHWLGHLSPNAVDSYYDDPAEEARKLDEKLAPGLNPIAMAFLGHIISDENEASRAGDPTSRLEFASNQLEYMGHCGKFSFCATTSVPIPCYRCKYFEPLRDAPHEEVLKALIFRQTEENSMVKAGETRNLLMPIDYTPDIRAVERCIALCNAKKK